MNENTKVAKGEVSKEKLIECAASLFLKNGYNATGINEIIRSAGLTKGSFYFYFPSKKDLAIAVTEHYNQLKINQVSKAAIDRNWEDFVEKLIGDIIKQEKKDKIYGCPFAVLGMETAFLEPDISARNYSSMKKMISICADVLKRSGVPEAKAIANAERAFAIYEGHLIFYRLSKDLNELEKLLLRDLKQIIND